MTVHNMIGLQTTVRQSATLEPRGDGSHRYAVKSQYWELSKWFQESKSWVDCGPFPTDGKIEGVKWVRERAKTTYPTGDTRNRERHRVFLIQRKKSNLGFS